MPAPWSNQLDQHEHLLARLEEAGTELAIVLGPEDGRDPGNHWVGAVLRISGTISGYPTILEAIKDDLFYPGTGRRLAAYRPDRTSPERAKRAHEATRRAWKTMKARRDRPASESPRPPTISASSRSRESNPATAYARNTRLKFERVYAAARKAFAGKNRQTALVKCRAALDLLKGEDIYGKAQPRIEQELARRIETLEQVRNGG